LKCFQEQHG